MLCLEPPMENCAQTHDRWSARAVPAAATNKDIPQQENGNVHDWRLEVSTVRQGPESVQHILAGCIVLAQNKYLERHNNALKIQFFEVLRSLDLMDTEETWYSRINPKPMYESKTSVRLRIGMFLYMQRATWLRRTGLMPPL